MFSSSKQSHTGKLTKFSSVHGLIDYVPLHCHTEIRRLSCGEILVFLVRDSGRSWCCGWRKTDILTAVLPSHHQPAVWTLAGGGALGQQTDILALAHAARPDGLIGLHNTRKTTKHNVYVWLEIKLYNCSTEVQFIGDSTCFGTVNCLKFVITVRFVLCI
jgi:hypothetical protein